MKSVNEMLIKWAVDEHDAAKKGEIPIKIELEAGVEATGYCETCYDEYPVVHVYGTYKVGPRVLIATEISVSINQLIEEVLNANRGDS